MRSPVRLVLVDLAIAISVVAGFIALAVLYVTLAFRDEPAPSYPRYDALMAAIGKKNPAAVEAELRKGTDPNAYPNDAASIRNESDISPLNEAISDGNLEVIRVLLDYRADPNRGDGWSACPLEQAADENRIDVMRLLLQRGARVNDSSSGSTALWRAAMDGKAPALAFLLTHGANPSTRANDETLLHALRTTGFGSAEIVAMLTKAGAKE